MKRVILLVLSSFSCIFGMQAPWENYKSVLVDNLRKGLEEQVAAKRIPLNKMQLDQTISNITWAIRKNGAGGKLIALYVYEGNEEYRAAFANPNNESYQELRNLMVNLAQKRFALAPEKGSIARAGGPVAQVSPDVMVISFNVGPKDSKKTSEEDKSYRARTLADLIVSLPVLYGTDAKIVIIAQGESTDIVSRATHRTGVNTIDTLIYLQAPVYEWEWNGQYVYNTDVAPAGFAHLYHFYSKAGWTPSAFNPERKFKQQASISGSQIKMPVKNVRMLKVNGANKLEDFTAQDFLSPRAIRNYAQLMDNVDRYMINFDLIATGFAEREAQAPAVAVNRFVTIANNSITASYGTSAIGQEKTYLVAELSPAQMATIKAKFPAEVRLSNAELEQIMHFPTAQGWVSYLSLGKIQRLELSQELENIKSRNVAELKRLS